VLRVTTARKKAPSPQAQENALQVIIVPKAQPVRQRRRQAQACALFRVRGNPKIAVRGAFVPIEQMIATRKKLVPLCRKMRGGILTSVPAMQASAALNVRAAFNGTATRALLRICFSAALPMQFIAKEYVGTWVPLVKAAKQHALAEALAIRQKPRQHLVPPISVPAAKIAEDYVVTSSASSQIARQHRPIAILELLRRRASAVVFITTALANFRFMSAIQSHLVTPPLEEPSESVLAKN
jgi:hypothetical protein